MTDQISIDFIAAELARHGVDMTSQVDEGKVLIECACGYELECTYDQLRAAPRLTAAGAAEYLLRTHTAAALQQMLCRPPDAQTGRIVELETELSNLKFATDLYQRRTQSVLDHVAAFLVESGGLDEDGEKDFWRAAPGEMTMAEFRALRQQDAR